MNENITRYDCPLCGKDKLHWQEQRENLEKSTVETILFCQSCEKAVVAEVAMIDIHNCIAGDWSHLVESELAKIRDGNLVAK